jgi:hypothetical protein
VPGVIGIQRPEGPPPTSEDAAALPIRDGAFAKELTKRSAIAAPRQVLAPTRTHLSGQEAAKALGAAWQQRFGQAAPPGALEVLVADWAHETGHGQAMMNYNFGGMKGTSPSGLSAAYLTHEGSGSSERTLVDHFRAYRSATEGATDYVSLLADRFPQAIDAARRGDPGEFVRALKQGGYFTGSEEAYTSSVVSLANRARTLGFEALGAGGVAGATTGATTLAGAEGHRPTNAFAASNLAAEAAHLSAFAPDSPRSVEALARADALAMADELSRAALRIAASGAPGRDDEF